MPDAYKKGLEKSLKSNNAIFSRHPNDSGLNGSYVVDLRLKDPTNSEPTFCRPYRLDPVIEEKLVEKCMEMQEKVGHVIEKS